MSNFIPSMFIRKDRLMMSDLNIAGKAFTDGIHKREINSTCALQASDAVIVTWTYNTAQPLPACIRE